MDDHNEIRVAVIGYGHLGKWHAQKIALHADVSLAFIVEPNSEKYSILSELYPKTKVVADHKETYDAIDAVIIVTPTSYHYSIIQDFIEQDIHVFCEKPMVTTIEESLAVGESLKKSKSLLQVGHSERFHEIWQNKEFLKKAIRGHDFFTLKRGAPFKGRATDVDVVQDLMIHDLDLLSFLLGKAPSKINAVGKKVRTNNWDYVVADLEYESGEKARIISSRISCLEAREIEIINSDVTTFFDLQNLKVSYANADEEKVGILNYEKRDHLLEEQKEFFGAIRGKNKISVGHQEAHDAVVLVNRVLNALVL